MLPLNAKLFESQIPSTHFKCQTAQQTRSYATHTQAHTHHCCLASFYSILSSAAFCLMPIQFIKCWRGSQKGQQKMLTATASAEDLDTHRSILANKFSTLEIFVIDVPWLHLPSLPAAAIWLWCLKHSFSHSYACVCACGRCVCVCASWVGKSFNCFLQLELLVSAPAYNCLAASVDCTAAASQLNLLPAIRLPLPVYHNSFLTPNAAAFS